MRPSAWAGFTTLTIADLGAPATWFILSCQINVPSTGWHTYRLFDVDGALVAQLVTGQTGNGGASTPQKLAVIQEAQTLPSYDIQLGGLAYCAVPMPSVYTETWEAAYSSETVTWSHPACWKIRTINYEDEITDTVINEPDADELITSSSFSRIGVKAAYLITHGGIEHNFEVR